MQCNAHHHSIVWHYNVYFSTAYRLQCHLLQILSLLYLDFTPRCFCKECSSGLWWQIQFSFSCTFRDSDCRLFSNLIIFVFHFEFRRYWTNYEFCLIVLFILCLPFSILSLYFEYLSEWHICLSTLYWLPPLFLTPLPFIFYLAYRIITVSRLERPWVWSTLTSSRAIVSMLTSPQVKTIKFGMLA